MKRALVTGASSGIGAAAARALAAEGFAVALLARRAAPLEEVRASLAGSGHRVLTCDLTDAAAIRAAAEELRAEWDGLELVVANAGVGYRALLSELDDELVERVFATNVLAPMRLARAGRMRRRAPWLTLRRSSAEDPGVPAASTT